MTNVFVVPESINPATVVLEQAKDFIDKYKPYELENGIPLLIIFDHKSEAFYTICHLRAEVIVSKSDIDATLEPNESEDYKLNREIYTDNYAYKKMSADASLGRSFEDLVVEYDTSYRPQKPLKIFGGQHRVKAITENLEDNIDKLHGVRVYFALSTEQRYDIATANNTSIAVSNDLLDRMREELLGPESRDWCQSVGLLAVGQNFADKRSSEGIPTVRLARTLIVNFYKGQEEANSTFPLPIVCTTGPALDSLYEDIRKEIDWNDKALFEMGQQFTALHKLQRDRVLSRDADSFQEFANKATHPSIAAAW